MPWTSLGMTRLRAPNSMTICAHLSRFSKEQFSNFHITDLLRVVAAEVAGIRTMRQVDTMTKEDKTFFVAGFGEYIFILDAARNEGDV